MSYIPDNERWEHMKAKVISISSGAGFADGRQRVTLLFEGADEWLARVQFPVDTLGLEGLGSGPHLDQEVEVDFAVRARGRGKS